MGSLRNSTAPQTPLVAEGVRFINGDLFAVDISEATHIYVASLCFSDSMLLRLAAKLASEAKNVRYVASLRQFPGGLAGFDKPRFLEAEMSWTAPRGGGSSVHVYRASRPIAD